MSTSLHRPALAANGRAVLGLLFNAMVWGLAWWPMRHLQAWGLHPLWATAIIFSISVVAITLMDSSAWRDLLTRPALWVILLAAGTTNACFNWGVTVGDVVRVVLLFYVMPLWAVLLARWLLHEPITGSALLRLSLALAGAAIVLWPASGTTVAPFNSIDLLGLLGGFTFALNNVMLKREAHHPGGGRGLAMFVGGALVSMVLALLLDVPAPPALSANWLLGAVGLGLAFLLSNLALQYSASRLAANVTAVIMLTEVLWASGSALALGAGTMTPSLAVGGGLIVGAAALAALKP
jgi:drug/metabolite transporter (DMT)-like permease